MTAALMPDACDASPERPDHDAARDTGSERWALAGFLGAELVALIIFMALARKMWFTTDEWEFLASRTAFNLGDLFRPHYDHWVTLPVLAYRALWWTFGLRSYRPYQLTIVLLHLTAALLVRAIMRRIGVRPWTATAVASVLVFFGTDFKNVISPFQITIVGSLVFGFVHMLLVARDDPTRRRDVLGVLAGGAGLMCSGVGVAMVIAVGVAMLVMRGWRSALLQTAPLGVVYLTWYAVIGHQRSQGSLGYDTSIGGIARFVGHLSSWTFSAMGQLFGVGALLAALLAVGLTLAWAPLDRAGFRRQAAIPIGLLVGAVTFMVVTAVGRADLGSLHDFGNRYLSIVVALVLPAVGVAADVIMKRWRAAIPVVIALLLVGIPGNVTAFARSTRDAVSADHEPGLREMILSLPRVPAAREVPPDVVPYPDGFTYLVTIGWLRAGAASGRIPKPRQISPEQQAMDTLRLSFLQSSARPRSTDVCASLQRPIPFHLETGEHIVVGAENGAAQIDPIGPSVRGTLPFTTITQFGPTYTATRPVRFRIRSLVSGRRLVCAAPASFPSGVRTFRPR